MSALIRSRWRHAIAGLVAVPLAAGVGSTAQAADPLVLDHGHIDAFNVSVEHEELVLDLKEDVTGSHVRRSPEDVLLRVKEDAWTEGIPEQYPGSPSGYVLPLTQDQDLIWPGWDTNGTAGSGYTDVKIDITGVEGPGSVYLYTLSGFGAVTPLLEGGGYELPGTLREKTPAHTHAQWTFSKAGEYTLEVQATATSPSNGKTLTSNTGTYSISVGDQPDQQPTSLAIEGLADHYHTGETVKLTAEPDVPTELDHYHWYSRDSADAEWEVAEGGEGDTYTGKAEVDGQQLKAELYGDDHEVVASSDAVTVKIDDHDDGTSGGDTGGSGGGSGTSGGGSGAPGDGSGSGNGNGDGSSSTGGSGGSSATGGSGGGNGGVEPQRCVPVKNEDSDGPVKSGETLVLDHGHIDAFNVVADGGKLKLNLKEDVTGSHVTHAPEDVALHVKPEALTDKIPDGYPGSPKGYLLPLTQDQNLIWPGWDTNGTVGSGYTDVKIDIKAVNGPGKVYLYTTTTFGGAQSLLEGGGYELPGTLREKTPAHTHAQWTFSKAGEYTLEVQATATNPGNGKTLTSNTGTYSFGVGDAPGGLKAQGGTATKTAAKGKTPDGKDCELDAGGKSPAQGHLAATGTGLTPQLIGVSIALFLVGTTLFVVAMRRRAAKA